MSELAKLVDKLPKDAEKAIAALGAFTWAKRDRVDGYYEKEGELVVDNSLDQLGVLWHLRKLTDDVYFGFLNEFVYEGAPSRDKFKLR